MKILYSQKLEQLPPYLFMEIDKIKNKMLEEGKDIINLSVGDPDMPTPDYIIKRLQAAAEDNKNHRYPFGIGLPQFRRAVAKWYLERLGVKLDPDTEVLAVIGSKEGIANFPQAFINNGDIGLVPDPGYPPYNSGVIFAGGEPYYLPLVKENDFLADLDSIPRKIADRAKLMFLNYPNNPTSAIAGEDYYVKVVDFAAKHNIIVAHDAAYSEICYDGYRPMSFLQVAGAKDVGVEFHSLSKTFNMTGWRIGFVVGNKDIIKGLAKVKSNIDSGVFRAVQCAGTLALETGTVHLEDALKIYTERRNVLVDGLTKLGWQVPRPKATFYVWVPVPPGRTSKEMALWLLEHTQVICTPGNGFGKYGEGYIRFSLTAPTERIKEAIARISDIHS